MADASVLLVGCVKGKRVGVHPARDLYSSPLWEARRAYAERAEATWFILSALHGLIEPDQPLAPYDLSLRDLAVAKRGEWAQVVVATLAWRLGSLDGRRIELHVGGAYREALKPLLLERGAVVEAPTATVSGVGAQIAWYRAKVARMQRRRLATVAEITAAVRALDESPTIVRACEWPGDLAHLNQPGMYSWWIDGEGAAMLSRGLGIKVRTGRIYAGLTGATSWPAGSVGKNTLRSRIGRSHIGGRVTGSTFRLTLASILRRELRLRVTRPGVLAAKSEAALTEWITDHLSVAVHPFSEADVLGDLERRVLARLDPPLNLRGMPPTPLRQRLTELRRTVKAKR